MQTYHLAPQTEKPIWAFLFSYYDKFMMFLAKKTARNQTIAQNKAMYGAKMFNSIIVFSSVEKDDINKKVPKGNKMNHAELLKHKVFLYTPEGVRKKNM